MTHRMKPLSVFALVLLAGCFGEGRRGEEIPRLPDHAELTKDLPQLHDPLTKDVDEEAVQALAPPFSEGIYPCSDCHSDPEDVNTERRDLEEHTDITLHHGSKERWCLDCHAANDRDKLHLVNGTLIEFTESYRLCGQCHGPKLRDWRAGVHGKRTGNWDGKKEYLLCVHCHNPHAPAFEPLEPKARPKMPNEISL